MRTAFPGVVKRMKRIGFESLWAAALLIAVTAPAGAQPQWVNNQAARAVIGQTSFTRQNPTPSRTILGAVGGVAVADGKLFVADGNRIGAGPVGNRTLIYHNLSSFLPGAADDLNQSLECPVCVGAADVVLGQTDFTKIVEGVQNGQRAPSGVHSDGIRLAVADTNNNRVLIWRTIPTTNNQAPDVVIGQPDMSTNLPRTTREGMRGPQGVWIADGKVFVADTQNSRVLIWNSIPASNGAPADIVVGQPDFNTRPEPDLTQSNFDPQANNLLDPVGVTVADGKMFVADLGFDRVMIYLSIPTANTPSADIVIGQKDFTTAGFIDHDDDATTATISSAVFDMCDELDPFQDDGTRTPNDDRFPLPVDRGDPEEGEELPIRYPARCEHTLNFPRFALYDGTDLYIADTGNDRILVYNGIPTTNGAAADAVIGQPDFVALTDAVGPGNLRNPTSLAHDGTNLYVAEPFTRRVSVFTKAQPAIALEGIRNGASFGVRAIGYLEWEGATTDDGQLVTVRIANRLYEFRTETGETAESVRDKIIDLIEADEFSLVTARPFNGLGTFARATVTFGGTPTAGEQVRMTIDGRNYQFNVIAGDPPERMVDRFLFVVNQAGGDPAVFIERDPSDVNSLSLVAKDPGPDGNNITISVVGGASTQLEIAITTPDDDPDDDEQPSTLGGGAFPRRIRLTSIPDGRIGNGITLESTMGGAGVTTSTSGSRLDGGSDARMIPPGTLTSIFGEGFTDQVYEASLDASGKLPTSLGGVEVFVNGKLAPLYAVSPNQINFQMRWDVQGIGSSTYVRMRRADGSVEVSAPRANQTPNFGPGLFANGLTEPRQAVALHGQGVATGTIGISAAREDDEIQAGTTLTITINGRPYAYVTTDEDSPASVRDSLINLINANGGDPDVIASQGTTGFFSARANITLTNDPAVGDTVTITIRDREYSYTAVEGDTVESVRNLLIQTINAGNGDIEVTARDISGIGSVVLQVIARELGESGNEIPFSVETSDGSTITAERSDLGEDDEDTGKLAGGRTDPVVFLTARNAGREGNDITYEAETSDATNVSATARANTLCCGNEPFSLITEDNPAIPGEIIILFGSGLGLTSPTPASEGLEAGEITPAAPLFNVPLRFEDFVASQAGGRTAQVEFVGLMPGFVGIYQLNLKLNEQLPDDPETPLYIAQQTFFSNTVAIPVKNLVPTDPTQ